MEYRITLEGWIYLADHSCRARRAEHRQQSLFLILAQPHRSRFDVWHSLFHSRSQASKCGSYCPNIFLPASRFRAMVELENEKLTLPSFSLRVEAAKTKQAQAAAMLETPVYFPYLPKHDRVQQTIPVTFPRRGVYRQEAFRIVTRSPLASCGKRASLT